MSDYTALERRLMAEVDRMTQQLAAVTKERDELLKDKERLDMLETFSCRIDVCDEGYNPKARWFAGRMYINTVREVADKYIDAAKGTE